MLSRNGYNNYEPIQQQQPQQPYEQQNYRHPNDVDENYYSSMRKSPVKRNKSLKSLLKKFQNATIRGQFDKVQYYVEQYGLLNETEHSLHGGRTCLMLSISRDNYELIDYFCQQEHIDLDAKGIIIIYIYLFIHLFKNDIYNSIYILYIFYMKQKNLIIINILIYFIMKKQLMKNIKKKKNYIYI